MNEARQRSDFPWSILVGMVVGVGMALWALAVRPDLYNAAMVGLTLGFWTGTMHFLVARRRWVLLFGVLLATLAFVVWANRPLY